MRRFSFLLISSLLLSTQLIGCAYRPEFGISIGHRRAGPIEGPVACIDYTQQIRRHTSFEIEHCSDPFRGRYLFNNDKDDLSHDTITFRHSFGGGSK